MDIKQNYITRHIFGILVGAYVTWFCFIGDHSVVHLLLYKRQQVKLEREIAAYRDSIANYEAQIEALKSEGDPLEQFAREELLMKRPDEDVFILQ
jgi:cell division protein FtsB